MGPGSNASEGVLANFFNSLLSKKSGQPGSPGAQIKAAGPNDDCKYSRNGRLRRPTLVNGHVDRVISILRPNIDICPQNKSKTWVILKNFRYKKV